MEDDLSKRLLRILATPLTPEEFQAEFLELYSQNRGFEEIILQTFVSKFLIVS